MILKLRNYALVITNILTDFMEFCHSYIDMALDKKLCIFCRKKTPKLEQSGITMHGCDAPVKTNTFMKFH